MTAIEVKCPKCGSNQVQKYGISESKKQRYLCRNEDCPAKTVQLEHNYRGCEQGINETMIIMASSCLYIWKAQRRGFSGIKVAFGTLWHHNVLHR